MRRVVMPLRQRSEFLEEFVLRFDMERDAEKLGAIDLLPELGRRGEGFVMVSNAKTLLRRRERLVMKIVQRERRHHGRERDQVTLRETRIDAQRELVGAADEVIDERAH